MDKRIIPLLILVYFLILGWCMMTDPAWCRFLPLGLGYLGCGILSRTRPGFQILQLICGYGSSIAVWQVSLVSGFFLLFIVYAVFLLQNQVLQSVSDGYWFFLSAGLSGVAVILLDVSFHTFLPAAGFIGLAGVCILALRIAVFRLDREFRGDAQ